MTWTDDTIQLLTVFWHQNASLLLYLSVNAGRLRLYRFPQNPERLAVILGRETQCCQN